MKVSYWNFVELLILTFVGLESVKVEMEHGVVALPSLIVVKLADQSPFFGLA